MSELPSLVESKATRFPPGDQRGLPVLFAFMSVSCNGFVPSLSQAQISPVPDLIEWNTILVPSGEKWGFVSHDVEEIKALGGNLLESFAVSSTLQTSQSGL
jgi:hypothetical protein